MSNLEPRKSSSEEENSISVQKMIDTPMMHLFLLKETKMKKLLSSTKEELREETRLLLTLEESISGV